MSYRGMVEVNDYRYINCSEQKILHKLTVCQAQEARRVRRTRCGNMRAGDARMAKSPTKRMEARRAGCAKDDRAACQAGRIKIRTPA